MPDDFIPLAAWLHPHVVPCAPEPQSEPVDVEAAAGAERDDIDEALGDARRFRAALADALACAVDDALTAIASDVLGRELVLSPVDLRRVVDRELERVRGEHVLRVRAHPSALERLSHLAVPVVQDERLHPGDVAFDVQRGTIDCSFGVRLQRALEGAVA